MSKKQIWVVVLCLGLAAFAAAGEEQASACPVQSAKIEVDQWKDLPADFASFATLPEEYKKAVYLRLDDAQRADLWQAHWRAALETGSFDGNQRDLIAEAGRFWTADTFAALRSADGVHYPATLQLARELETRLKAFFDDRQMTSLFGRVGPVRSQTVFASEPGVPDLAAATGKRIFYRPMCNCSVEYNDCGTPYTCGMSEICLPAGGCGYLYMSTCDGQCRVSSPPNPCP